MHQNPFQSPESAAGPTPGSFNCRRWTTIPIALVVIMLNPYPMIDLIVGGFTGVVATNRLSFLLSVSSGYLGTVAAYAFNYLLFVFRSTGMVYSGTVNILSLFVAVTLYGGLGVLLGTMFNMSLAKPK